MKNNFEKILSPLKGKKTAGEDLKHTAIFDTLKELRKEDDQNISYGVWQRPLKTPDWNTLKGESLKLLEEKTKDLQVLGWYSECLIIESGFDGLKSSLKLLHEFIQKFWKDLHPDSKDSRILLLEWIEKNYVSHILALPITDSPMNTISLDDWRYAIHMSKMPNTSFEDEDKKSLEELRNILSTSRQAFIDKINLCISESRDCLQETRKFLDTQYGADSPTFSQLFKCLEEITNILKNEYIKPNHQELEEDEEIIVNTPLNTDTKDSELKPDVSIGQTKEELYHTLSEISEKLRKLDSSSPVPDLIEIAASWKDKTFTEILTDILSNDDKKYEIFRLLNKKSA